MPSHTGMSFKLRTWHRPGFIVHQLLRSVKAWDLSLEVLSVDVVNFTELA